MSDLARRAALELARPQLLEVERRALQVRIEHAQAELREADPNAIVQPDQGRPPRALGRPRPWTDYEQGRLARVWDREMHGTGAEGVLGAQRTPGASRP